LDDVIFGREYRQASYEAEAIKPHIETSDFLRSCHEEGRGSVYTRVRCAVSYIGGQVERIGALGFILRVKSVFGNNEKGMRMSWVHFDFLLLPSIFWLSSHQDPG